MSFITKNIWLLSLVSMFNDISTEMLFPVLPVYLEQIGFTGTAIGLLEGTADMLASYGKGLFGAWSDQRGVRKPFIVWGYALSGLSKFVMGLWSLPSLVFGARLLDKTGKGVRTAARDAILSDEATASNKGKVFGFHRSLDTLGAVIGPVIALYLLSVDSNIQHIFIYAVIPAVVSIGLIVFIREKKQAPTEKKASNPFLFFAYWNKAPSSYRKLLAVLLMFTFFNASDMFLILWVKQHQGLSFAISCYIIYNVVYALGSYPMGVLADKKGSKVVIVLGFVVFSVTYLLLPVYNDRTWMLALWAFYGLYSACVEGNSKAWISNITLREQTGTALGLYGSAVSVLQIISGLFAGLIWDSLGGAGLFQICAIGVAFCAGMAMFVPSKLQQAI